MLEVRVGQPKGPAVAELVILGHWGYPPQARRLCHLPYAHVLRVLYTLTYSEEWGHLSQVLGPALP